MFDRFLTLVLVTLANASEFACPDCSPPPPQPPFPPVPPAPEPPPWTALPPCPDLTQYLHEHLGIGGIPSSIFTNGDRCGSFWMDLCKRMCDGAPETQREEWQVKVLDPYMTSLHLWMEQGSMYA